MGTREDCSEAVERMAGRERRGGAQARGPPCAGAHAARARRKGGAGQERRGLGGDGRWRGENKPGVGVGETKAAKEKMHRREAACWSPEAGVALPNTHDEEKHSWRRRARRPSGPRLNKKWASPSAHTKSRARVPNCRHRSTHPPTQESFPAAPSGPAARAQRTVASSKRCAAEVVGGARVGLQEWRGAGAREQWRGRKEGAPAPNEGQRPDTWTHRVEGGRPVAAAMRPAGAQEVADNEGQQRGKRRVRVREKRETWWCWAQRVPTAHQLLVAHGHREQAGRTRLLALQPIHTPGKQRRRGRDGMG